MVISSGPPEMGCSDLFALDNCRRLFFYVDMLSWVIEHLLHDPVRLALLADWRGLVLETAVYVI